MFKKEHVEIIANDRMEICKRCTFYDDKGTGCEVPGTAPCCNKKLGGCGCSLNLKTRSLSSECPLPVPKWNKILTEKEEDDFNSKNQQI